MKIKKSISFMLITIFILSMCATAIYADMQYRNDIYEPNYPVYCPLYPKHQPYWLWTSSVYVLYSNQWYMATYYQCDCLAEIYWIPDYSSTHYAYFYPSNINDDGEVSRVYTTTASNPPGWQLPYGE